MNLQRQSGVLKTLLALLGLILLLAASLKTHQLATEPIAGKSLLSNRWLLIGWIELELVLGLWLISGLARRSAWGAALACFSIFSVVTLFKALGGETSCGCFGRIEVNPWYTLILDVGIVLALLIFHPDFRTTQPVTCRRLRLAAIATVILAAGIPAGLAAALYKPSLLADDGRVTGEARVVLLEPEKWLGARCPLLKHIDIGDQLAKGQWTMVLYHHDCPHCQEKAARFEREARKQSDRLGGAKTAMVELAPYAPPGRSLLPPDTVCVTGRLSETHDWFVQTPTILVLDEGRVLAVAEDSKPPAHGELASLRPIPNKEPIPVTEEGYDFGFVEPKSTHNARLAVPNPSGKTLRIHKVRSECKCMTATASEEPLAPGVPVKVEMTFVAPREALPYAKRLLLVTSDPEHPLLPIWIKAAVGLPLEAKPSSLNLRTLAVGETRKAEVAIVNRGKKPVRLLYCTSSVAGCFAKVSRNAILPGDEVLIPVMVDAQETGTKKGALHIATDVDTQRDLAVLVQFAATSQAGPSRDDTVDEEPSSVLKGKP